jgi:DNA-binding beta-propeller fold protein YncE
MKKVFSLLLLHIFVITIAAQQVYISDKLSKKWETPGDLKVPESVYYDDLKQVIYVSNVTGSSADKDNSGFLSKVSPDGKILSLKWVSGLNAPKGIGVIGNLLYVSDIDRVAEIDIEAGKITRMIEIPGSKFLNDIATDVQGNVYVSDSEKSTIHMIRQGKVDLLVESDKLEGINGLFIYEGNLLAGVKDRVVSINLRTKEIKDYILDTGGIDGLVTDGKGNFLISDWKGNIHLISPMAKKEKLADTSPANVNAADIDYIISKKLLLVPTFSDNKVVAYELK